MYICGYFFQKGYFKGYSKGTPTKYFGRADESPTPPVPEGLQL